MLFIWCGPRQTFAEYVTQHVMMPFLKLQITPTVAQIDSIWDNYPEDRLKSLTHQHRGTGPRTRIGDGHTRIPKHDWNRITKRSYSFSLVRRLSRKIWVGHSFSVPYWRVFFPTDHVMYQFSSPATTLKQIQGYFFIWHMLQQRATRQLMFVPLIVMWWFLPYTSFHTWSSTAVGVFR